MLETCYNLAISFEEGFTDKMRPSGSIKNDRRVEFKSNSAITSLALDGGRLSWNSGLRWSFLTISLNNLSFLSRLIDKRQTFAFWSTRLSYSLHLIRDAASVEAQNVNNRYFPLKSLSEITLSLLSTERAGTV